ncbi:NHR-19 protein [Aphelenchoides avenae]|nr:NHR-19 protein [Aphelenchus avenae]
MRADISSLLKWLRMSRLFDDVANEDRVFLLSRFMLPYLVLEKCYFNALIPDDGDSWFDYSGKVTSRRWNGPADDEDGRRLHLETMTYMMDHVTAPMRRLKLCTEEFVACKAVLLLSCGQHSFDDSFTNFISQQSRNAAVHWRTCIISGLLQFYEANRRPNAAERLGEVLLFASSLQAAAVKGAATITRLRKVNDLRLDAHTENLLFGAA